MTDHESRIRAFNEKHIAETIAKMADQLRRSADALERVAKDPRSTAAWRSQEAWSEIRSLNSNLRVDILISTLGGMIESHERLDADHG